MTMKKYLFLFAVCVSLALSSGQAYAQRYLCLLYTSHNTVDVPTLFWAAIPGNAGDFPSEESFYTFIEQALCLSLIHI